MNNDFDLDTASFTRQANHAIPFDLWSDSDSGHEMPMPSQPLPMTMGLANALDSAAARSSRARTRTSIGNLALYENSIPIVSTTSQQLFGTPLVSGGVPAAPTPFPRAAHFKFLTQLQRRVQMLESERQSQSLTIQSLQHQLKQTLKQQKVLVLVEKSDRSTKSSLNWQQILATAQAVIDPSISIGNLVLACADAPVTSASDELPAVQELENCLACRRQCYTDTDAPLIPQAPVNEVGIGHCENDPEPRRKHALVQTIATWPVSSPERTAPAATANVGPQPTITRLPDSSPSHEFPADIVTPHRPPGDGPAPFHVTLRYLRPSVSHSDLIALATGTDLVKLYYPPHTSSRYVGRAATYFFANAAQAKHFYITTKMKMYSGDMQAKFGLNDVELAEAVARGAQGPYRIEENKSNLGISWSDPQSRNAKRAWQLEKMEVEQQDVSGQGKRTSEPKKSRVKEHQVHKKPSNMYDVLQSEDNDKEDEDLSSSD
ncbi:hypothetical protein BCR44DRAFT_1429249 [Catenaria anguillulae PL171]|uniref:Uncharacterized protein n=1 Tax=Catenaria anguillulae PL171 TaxID=765915 RepID=A0A1Y2HTJ2_9FUNG|nr:hypothetical protein BCR44DRAFT_1429249 [Catenaria anguillulae PL171]